MLRQLEGSRAVGINGVERFLGDTAMPETARALGTDALKVAPATGKDTASAAFTVFNPGKAAVR